MEDDVSDEPGSQDESDRQLAELMTGMVAAALDGGDDGERRAAALLREIERREPGTVERMAAGLRMARLGLRSYSTAH